MELSGRRALVTGGLGFIGLNLVGALARAGARVRIVNRSLDPLALAWLAQVAGREVEIHQGDIADGEAMQGWLEGVDLVFNLAGESGAAKSLRDAQADMQVNVAGHLNLLETIRARQEAPRVVFVSSRLVYGVTGSAPVGERHPPQPTSVYGLHKLTVEHYYRLYHQHFGIPYAIMRLTNPYGPFQLPHRRHYGVVNGFVMAALKGETIRLFGGAPQLRDYLYVGDAVEALLRLGLDERAVGETVNVGAGRSVPLAGMAEAIVALAGSGRIEVAPWPEQYEKVETGDFVCDTGRAERLLGWRPQVGMEEGLRRTVEAYRTLLAGMD